MKKKFLICGHDLRFLQPFIDYIESHIDFELRIHHHAGHLINNEDRAKSDLEWAEIIFCEWALGNAEWFSWRKKDHQRLIVRLHSQEIEARHKTLFFWKINWHAVDRLILISDHLFYWVQQNHSVAGSKATLIYNPIPTNTLYEAGRKRKFNKVLGLVGIVPARKRFDLAIELLRQLLERDPEWSLRITGAKPSDYPWMKSRVEEMKWYDQIFEESNDLVVSGKLVYDSYSRNIEHWYAGIDYILSLSDFEGSHQAIAEGMASGCVPVIRDWTGASQLYPTQQVFSSLPDITSFLLTHSCNQFLENSSKYSSLARQLFDQSDICRALLATCERTTTDATISIKMPPVCILAYIPLGSRNGYRIRVEQEIQNLARLGHQVLLICLVPNTNDSNRSSVKGNEEYSHRQELSAFGCKTHIIQTDDFFSLDDELAAPVELLCEIEILMSLMGIRYLHCEALYCARIGLRVKKRNPSCILSIDWHGVVPEESQMGGSHEKRVRFLEQKEIECFNISDINILVSEAMYEHYTGKYSLPLSNRLIIPCCIGAGYTGHAKIEEGKDYVRKIVPSLTENDIVFAYVGSAAEWQCSVETIKLFSALQTMLPASHLIVASPNSDHKQWHQIIGSMNICGAGITVTSLDHSNIGRFLAGVDYAFLLRKQSTVNKVASPTKYAEYLAAGCAIIMTPEIGDFSFLTSQYNLGYIISGPIDNISQDKICHLAAYISNSANRQIKLRRLRQQVTQDHLAWPPFAKLWSNAIIKLTGYICNGSDQKKPLGLDPK